MKRILLVCASGAAMLFGVNAFAGETAAEATVETPSDGAPVQEITDPTAAIEGEATVEGDVAPEGEGDIDAEAVVEGEATVEGEVAPEGEGDIDAEASAEGEAAAEEPASEAAAEGEAEVAAEPDPQ